MSEIIKFLPFDTSNLRIGILGGSFNPAHKGHLFISEEAIRILNLDYLVWLVSPQNPLKEKSQNSFEHRFDYSKNFVKNTKIIVSDYEKNLPSPHYTSNTLTAIKKDSSSAKLFWIIGADNMIQMPKWENWEKILSLATLVVFDRDDCMEEALNGDVAKKFKRGTIADQSYKETEDLDWLYIKIPKVDISSTKIREGQIVKA